MSKRACGGKKFRGKGIKPRKRAKKKVRDRNAAALESPLFRQRVKPSRKKLAAWERPSIDEFL